MTDRADLIDRFLHDAGWKKARAIPMAGDASARRYIRLIRADDHRAVLMDAAPENDQDVAAFVSVQRFLTSNGFSAPAILAADMQTGLLLLEDFGDDLFARLMADDPERQAQLYSAAVDMLVALGQVQPPGNLANLTAGPLATMIGPCFDWYSAGIGQPVPDGIRSRLLTDLETCFQKLIATGGVFSLRDCHAENLMWLPDRAGVARVGLLDFQDAVVVHPAYDLVSLLQDARRDVPQDITVKMIHRFADAGGWDLETLGAAYAALGLQRNLRILGIFTRLAAQQRKTRYLALIPRVWSHVDRNLNHPALAEVAARIRDAVPEPTEQRLKRLADRVDA